jgi:AcrR family transcriptional regulator
MTSQSERSERTRTRLLDAALKILVQNGYAAASTIRIVKEAGVSRGTMLHHFPNKAALMQAVLRRVLKARERAFHRALDRGTTTRAFSTIVHAFWEAVSAEEAFIPWLELTVAARTEPSLREVLAAAADDIERVIEDNFRRLFNVDDAPEIARLVPALGISVLQGLAMGELIHPNPQRTQRVLQVVESIAEARLIAYLNQRR